MEFRLGLVSYIIDIVNFFGGIAPTTVVYHFAPSVFGNMDIFFVINHFNLDKWMKSVWWVQR